MLHLFMFFFSTLAWQVMGIALCQTQFQVVGFKLSVGLLERGGVTVAVRGVQRISSEPFLCTAPLRPHSRLQVDLIPPRGSRRRLREKVPLPGVTQQIHRGPGIETIHVWL